MSYGVNFGPFEHSNHQFIKPFSFSVWIFYQHDFFAYCSINVHSDIFSDMGYFVLPI